MTEFKTIGKYRILGVSGRGGMADVYLGEPIEGGPKVALKMFSRKNTSSVEFRRRVKREIDTLQECSHPNIVGVKDFSLDPEEMFLVLDYHEGKNLEELVKDGHPFSPREICSIIYDVSSALGHCHGKGIFHRDIKPANILIERSQGRAILLDFGIVKATNMTTITKYAGIMGSLGYLAPEQILGGTVDGRTDLYQLGMVMVYLATGKNPIQGTDEFAMVDARSLEDLRAHRAMPRIRESLPGFPESVETIILNCIQIDQLLRYPNAEALMEDLTRVSRGDPVRVLGAS